MRRETESLFDPVLWLSFRKCSFLQLDNVDRLYQSPTGARAAYWPVIWPSFSHHLFDFYKGSNSNFLQHVFSSQIKWKKEEKTPLKTN